MVRATCWCAVVLAITMSVSAQQTIYFNKRSHLCERQGSRDRDARANRPDGADGAVRFGIVTVDRHFGAAFLVHIDRLGRFFARGIQGLSRSAAGRHDDRHKLRRSASTTLDKLHVYHCRLRQCTEPFRRQ